MWSSYNLWYQKHHIKRGILGLEKYNTKIWEIVRIEVEREMKNIALGIGHSTTLYGHDIWHNGHDIWHNGQRRPCRDSALAPYLLTLMLAAQNTHSVTVPEVYFLQPNLDCAHCHREGCIWGYACQGFYNLFRRTVHSLDTCLEIGITMDSGNPWISARVFLGYG